MEPITVPDTLQQALGRLLLATLLGAALGVNREIRHKPAGFRTHSLVALGSALFALVGLGVGGATGAAPADLSSLSRVIQGLVAGVGFVGGGVILHRDDPKGAHGLTTAASLWVVCALGIATGIGLWRTATATLVLSLVVLTVGTPVDRLLHRIRPSKADPAGETSDDSR